MKLSENHPKGSGDMVRTRKCFGRNDGQTDGLIDGLTDKGHSYNPFYCAVGINNLSEEFN